MPTAVRSSLAAFAISALAGAALCTEIAASCAPVTPERIEHAEQELCNARAIYRAVALAAGGKLDPAPGTPRETLERAEDEFCAARAARLAAAGDGGA